VPPSSGLNIKTVCSAVTLIPTYKSTVRHDQITTDKINYVSVRNNYTHVVIYNKFLILLK
jgi:hypothetical protein